MVKRFQMKTKKYGTDQQEYSEMLLLESLENKNKDTTFIIRAD